MWCNLKEPANCHQKCNTPGHAPPQYGQRTIEVNHAVQPGEKNGGAAITKGRTKLDADRADTAVVNPVALNVREQRLLAPVSYFVKITPYHEARFAQQGLGCYFGFRL